MSYSTKKMDLIERYFEGNLTPEEELFFIEEMKKSDSFKSEVEQYEFVFKGFRVAQEKQLRNQLKAYDNELDWKLKKKRKKPYRAIISALSVAAVLAIALLLGDFSGSTSTNTGLAINFFKPYPNVIAPVSRGGGLDSDFFRAMKLYEAQEYSSAISLYDDLIPSSEFKNELYFYKGLSLLAEGNAEQALYNFDLMVEGSNFDEPRKWYRSIALIHLDETSTATTLLEQIIDEQSYFKIYAEDLLDSLQTIRNK